jgi:hypothetical protein
MVFHMLFHGRFPSKVVGERFFSGINCGDAAAREPGEVRVHGVLRLPIELSGT